MTDGYTFHAKSSIFILLQSPVDCFNAKMMSYQDSDSHYKVTKGCFKSRTTRTPSFWDTPATPWLPILVIHIRSQIKTRQSRSYKFKKIAKNSNLEILQETLHATHLLKLLDNMHKYEIDPTRQTDGQTDGVKPIYPPNNFVVRGNNKNVIMPVYRVQSIFCKILTKDTPKLAREGELWGVFCESNVWLMLCHCHHSAECNIVTNVTAL